MSADPVTIDLGTYPLSSDDAGPVPELEPAPPWPWLGRPRRWHARRWGTAALAVLMGGGLGGAAAPAEPALVLLWTVPGVAGDPFGNVAAGERDLYAVTSTAEGWALTAFRIEDGGVRWATPVEPLDSVTDPDPFGVGVVDGTPVVTASGFPGRTTWHDPDTGEPQWTNDGVPAFVGDGMVALHHWGEEDRTLGLSVAGPAPGSGSATVWLDPARHQYGFWESPGGAVQLVTLRRDGVLTRYDLATGAAVRSVSTRHEAPPFTFYVISLTVVDDLVVVADETPDGSEVVVYDAATLERRWTARNGLRAASCGPVVCLDLGDRDSGPYGEVRGVDPVTGAHRWSRSCGDRGACYLSVEEMEPDDRLWVQETAGLDTGEPSSRSWIVDSGTGRTLAGPAGWGLQQQVGSDLLLASDARWTGGDEQSPLWWAWSGSDLAEIDVLGIIAADWCQLHHPYLVCWTEGEPVEVWRVNR